MRSRSGTCCRGCGRSSPISRSILAWTRREIMLRSALPMLAVAALAATIGAQEPPRPPVSPVPAPTPVPAPAPAPRARGFFDQLEHELRMREWSLQDRMHELTPRIEELQHSFERREWALFDRLAPHMDGL